MKLMHVQSGMGAIVNLADLDGAHPHESMVLANKRATAPCR